MVIGLQHTIHSQQPQTKHQAATQHVLTNQTGLTLKAQQEAGTTIVTTETAQPLEVVWLYTKELF